MLLPRADAPPEGRRCRGTSARPRGPARGGAVTGPADGPGGRRRGWGPGTPGFIARTRSREARRGPDTPRAGGGAGCWGPGAPRSHRPDAVAEGPPRPRHADPGGCRGLLPPPGTIAL